MRTMMFVKYAAVLTACAGLAAAAHAQMTPYGRSSHLVGSANGGFTPGSIDATYTNWSSDTHSGPAVAETTTFTANSIDVHAAVDGFNYWNQMQHYGWSSVGHYTGDFTFELPAPATFTLNGMISSYIGSGTVRLYSVTTGTDVFVFTNHTQYSTSGSLAAGRYSLHLEAIGYPMEGGAAAVTLTSALTIIPTPGAASLCAMCGFVAARRRRSA